MVYNIQKNFLCYLKELKKKITYDIFKEATVGKQYLGGV
jgi:hypothetical protein